MESSLPSEPLIIFEGSLAKYAGPGGQVRAPAGQTVLEILATLSFPVSRPVAVLANGITVDLNYRLRLGDRIQVIPVIAGG